MEFHRLRYLVRLLETAIAALPDGYVYRHTIQILPDAASSPADAIARGGYLWYPKPDGRVGLGSTEEHPGYAFAEDRTFRDEAELVDHLWATRAESFCSDWVVGDGLDRRLARTLTDFRRGDPMTFARRLQDTRSRLLLTCVGIVASEVSRTVAVALARNRRTPGFVLGALLRRPEHAVRWFALGNPSLPRRDVTRATASADLIERWFLLASHPIDPDIADAWIRHDDQARRVVELTESARSREEAAPDEVGPGRRRSGPARPARR